MPVCICGMMRCGTSVTAAALQMAGLNLGTVGTSTGLNPKGSFENMAMSAVNQQLFALAGGSFTHPPFITRDFLIQATTAGITAQAQTALTQFTGVASWGWKQGPTSIVLPFWQSLVPNLSYIICWRHPLEAAESMTVNMGVSKKIALLLWHFYIEMALHHTAGHPRTLALFDGWWAETNAMLTRLAGFAGLTGSYDPAQAAATLSAFFEAGLAHYNYTLADLLADPLVDPRTVSLYQQLAAGNLAYSYDSFFGPTPYQTVAYFYAAINALWAVNNG